MKFLCLGTSAVMHLTKNSRITQLFSVREKRGGDVYAFWPFESHSLRFAWFQRLGQGQSCITSPGAITRAFIDPVVRNETFAIEVLDSNFGRVNPLQVSFHTRPNLLRRG